MLAPVGIENIAESIRPIKKHKEDTIADSITNPLKLLVIFFAIIQGNTIKLDIIKVPIILIPRTTTKAVIRAIKNW